MHLHSSSSSPSSALILLVIRVFCLTLGIPAPAPAAAAARHCVCCCAVCLRFWPNNGQLRLRKRIRMQMEWNGCMCRCHTRSQLPRCRSQTAIKPNNELPNTLAAAREWMKIPEPGPGCVSASNLPAHVCRSPSPATPAPAHHLATQLIPVDGRTIKKC